MMQQLAWVAIAHFFEQSGAMNVTAVKNPKRVRYESLPARVAMTSKSTEVMRSACGSECERVRGWDILGAWQGFFSNQSFSSLQEQVYKCIAIHHIWHCVRELFSHQKMSLGGVIPGPL